MEGHEGMYLLELEGTDLILFNGFFKFLFLFDFYFLEECFKLGYSFLAWTNVGTGNMTGSGTLVLSGAMKARRFIGGAGTLKPSASCGPLQVFGCVAAAIVRFFMVVRKEDEEDDEDDDEEDDDRPPELPPELPPSSPALLTFR